MQLQHSPNECCAEFFQFVSGSVPWIGGGKESYLYGELKFLVTKFQIGQHHKLLSTVCGTVLGAGYQYKRIWSQKLAEEFQDRKKRLQVYNFRKKILQNTCQNQSIA